MYKSNDMLFKDLTDEEEREYREWARKEYKKYETIKDIWHPVVQDECTKMNKGE